MAEDRILRSFTVPVPAEHAFDVFTAGFSRWWPAEYTWSGAVLRWIGVEARQGGACFELGPEGFRAAMASPHGWDHILDRYRRALA